MSEEQVESEDTFFILVATDNHLGFAEKDAVRGKDSMNTFEEILSLAKEHEVDMILLGGDLFHDNKPSRKCIHECMRLIRKYCMGDRPVQIEFLSDQSENFKSSGFPVVNYEDPNLNVSIPIFSIHGNHDDPNGAGGLCTLDLFSVTGLINYFGKTTDLEKISIQPLLLQKGKSKLAIYGLGSIKDERLHRLFREGKVTSLRPAESEKDWFNMFVIHQNRAAHSQTNHIPGSFLDEYLDLVIWGHEHECKLEPEFERYENHQGFYVSQPGSSVATSLCPGESKPKHVGLLQIHKKAMKMSQLPLKTVRQFFFEDISIPKLNLDRNSSLFEEKMQKYLEERVDFLLNEAELERIGNSRTPDKPLIRLRVEIEEKVDACNVQRFGQPYVDKVANPKDIILFHVRRHARDKDKGGEVDRELLNRIIAENVAKIKVKDMVKKYFDAAEEKLQLTILSENGMGMAVEEFVDKQEKDAIHDLVDHQLHKVQKHLVVKKVEDDTIEPEILRLKEERLNNSHEESEVRAQLARSRVNHVENNDDGQISPELGEEDSDISTNANRSARGGRARGRPRAAGSSARGSGPKGRRKASDETSPTPKRGRGRGRGSSTRGAKNTLKDAFSKGTKKSTSMFFSSSEEEQSTNNLRNGMNGSKGATNYDSSDSI